MILIEYEPHYIFIAKLCKISAKQFGTKSTQNQSNQPTTTISIQN